MRSHRSIDSFGTILSGLSKRLGLESRLFEFRLEHQWREIVGDPIAAHTRPDQIRFKKLHLIVRNSVWMQQLTFLKPALLARLNAQAGTDLISDITFRVGEIPQRDQPADSPAAAHMMPAITEAALTEASAHAAAVQDPDLRNRLTQLMAESFSRSARP
jgi:predicted nucleic acid-binding Zn ribbon protein